MNQSPNPSSAVVEIDLLQLIEAIWKRIWIVIAATLLCGLLAFVTAKFIITPTYQSSARMYVNNTTERTSNTITSAEITAAKNLLDVYIVILNSESTLDAVIEEANLPYTTRYLAGMISAKAVSSTEVFEITATSTDPAEAKLIVDTMLDILPDRIAEIVEGSSAKVVSEAKLPTHKAAPSVKRYTLIGLLLGLVVSCGVIVVLEMLDTTVHESSYLTETYKLPVLAIVPDMRRKKKHSGYYGDYYYRKEA